MLLAEISETKDVAGLKKVVALVEIALRSDKTNEVLNGALSDASSKVQELQRQQDSDALMEALQTWKTKGTLFTAAWQAAAEITPEAGEKVTAAVPEMVQALVTAFLEKKSLDRKLLDLTREVNEAVCQAILFPPTRA